jgi:agmatinase
MGTPLSHACAMRQTLVMREDDASRHRSLSTEEAADIPSLNTTIFYDYNMRRDPNWMDRVVDTLNDDVYITIDVDGFDPAIMPATGTPEPGGLSWYEGLALLRKVIEKRNVVAWDIVELSPMGGNVAPNFLCAKLFTDARLVRKTSPDA